MEGGGCAEIVEDEAAVCACRGEDAGFGLVEGDGGDSIDAGGPVEGLGGVGRGAVQIVEADGGGGRGGEGGFVSVPRYAREGVCAEPGRGGAAVRRSVVRIVELDRLVTTAGEQCLIFRPAHPLHQIPMRLRLPNFIPTG